MSLSEKEKKEKEFLSCGRPADFSFRQMKTIDVSKFLDAIGLEGVRYTRVGGVPEKGPQRKFLTKSLWLNNNKLKSTKNVDELAENVLEYPSELSWIDFSFNYITEIKQVRIYSLGQRNLVQRLGIESILKFPHIKILYFHGNCLNDLNEVFKLRTLKELRSVTFHGNPIANHPHYRAYVVSVLPQIVNLDFTPVVKTEKLFPAPCEAVKKFREEKELARQQRAK